MNLDPKKHNLDPTWTPARGPSFSSHNFFRINAVESNLINLDGKMKIYKGGSIVRYDSCKFHYRADFVNQLRIEGMSKQTISAYCLHLNLFFRHTRISPTRISKSYLRKYVCDLFDSGKYAGNTIALKIRSLKRFYGFLHRIGRILCNPTENLREPFIRNRLPRKVLSAANMEKIRHSIKGKSFYMLRDLAVIEVLYATGIRLSELTGLEIRDVDFSGEILWIRKGKGGNDRCCVLSRHAIAALKTYLPLRSKLVQDPEALWISRYGTCLSKEMIRYILKKAALRAGVKGPSNPHAWRHGVATALFRRGASILEVQKFLGHASPDTTTIYTHLTVRDLKRIHEKTHPREQDTIPENILSFSLTCNLY